MLKTKEEWKSTQREGYPLGKAWHLYSHILQLDRSLTKASGSIRAASTCRVCNWCTRILSQYLEAFKGLIRQGTWLQKRKHVNPYPKCTNTIPYGGLMRQNEWLVANVFDSLGNYLYRQPCIVVLFGISRQIGTSTECQAENLSPSCGWHDKGEGRGAEA